VTVEAGVQRDVVVLPAETVLEGPAGRFVFVVRDDDKVRQVPVKLTRLQDRMAVVVGLQGGEQVVAQGGRDMRDGASVRIAGGQRGKARAAQATP
jgi:hypothetical protein